ncbi:transcription factor CP2 related protein [Sarotherodon galilaeus]
MEMPSLLFLCLVAAFSVRAVHGRTLELSIDDEDADDVDMEFSMGESGFPGKCWACEWIVKKMKKFAGPNATVESLTAKFHAICDEIGLLKSLCRKFVKVHLGVLIEEVTTTDDVWTICVNTGACKAEEVDLFFYPKEGGPDTEIKEFQ